MKYMVSIQQKIVDEIVDEYKNNEHVIGVCVFGSVAAARQFWLATESFFFTKETVILENRAAGFAYSS